MKINREFKEVKRKTIVAAKELCYSKDIIEALENATNESELTRIMTTARKKEK